MRFRHPVRLVLTATIIVSAAVMDLPRARGSPPDGSEAAGQLYRQHCQRCHGDDGKGDGDQPGLPARPDFTRSAWQQQRSDAQLLASLLDGKGKSMPSFRDRLSEVQAKSLIAHLRAFAPGGSSAGATKQTAPTASAA
jgi:mono/diheme cytochrome c family protein